MDDSANQSPSLRSWLFSGYRIDAVYRAMDDRRRAEVLDLWTSTGAVRDPSTRASRCEEVVLMAYAPSGALAGVSTAGTGQRPSDGRTVYDYRMFLLPAHRIPYLMRTMTLTTRDWLRDRAAPASGAVGMRIVTENPKLMRPGMRAYFKRHGFVFLGRTRQGLDVWLAPFGEDLQ